MDQNKTNTNKASRKPTIVDSELLFEAAETFIRALSAQDPAMGELAAIESAINSEALAPFDGPVVHEAVMFLRRMGYLSTATKSA